MNTSAKVSGIFTEIYQTLLFSRFPLFNSLILEIFISGHVSCRDLELSRLKCLGDRDQKFNARNFALLRTLKSKIFDDKFFMQRFRISQLAKRIATLAVMVGSASLMNQAYAVPMLQLGIGGGSYDLASETIVSDADSFTLYAYGKAWGGKAIDVAETHYISIALTPQTGPGAVPFGTFEFAGMSFDFTSSEMVYGHPPLESFVEKDPGDLASHGEFPTFYFEHAFTFSDAMKTGLVNTQDSPDHVPTAGGDKLYFAAFDVDVSGMIPGFGLHFDLYNTQLKSGGDVDIDNFAPFSHDAGTAPQVSEPSTSVLLFGVIVSLLGYSRRRAKRRSPI